MRNRVWVTFELVVKVVFIWDDLNSEQVILALFLKDLKFKPRNDSCCVYMFVLVLLCPRADMIFIVRTWGKGPDTDNLDNC